MHVSIIGGSGFIGTALSSLFIETKTDYINFDIKKSLRYPGNHRFCDVTDAESLRGCIQHTDVIINLAAEHSDDVRPISLYYKVNQFGAENVCNIAREKKVNTILFTSTVAVYGLARQNAAEDAFVNPFNDYGKSKLLAEKIYLNWYSEDPKNRTLIIVRPTVVFGINNRGNVFNFLKTIFENKFIMIGSGANSKSIAYVKNLVSFMRYTLSLPKGSYLSNYIDKPDLTMNELVKLSMTFMRKNRKTIRVPRFLGLMLGYGCDLFTNVFKVKLSLSSVRVRKFCSDTTFDSNAGKLGFVAPYSLGQALQETIEVEFLKCKDAKSS